jgi:hypothetical protein
VIEAGGDHPDGVEALLADRAHCPGVRRRTDGLFIHPHSA